jgi:hypothetical protein
MWAMASPPEAIDALADTLSDLGFSAVVAPDDGPTGRPDLVVTTPSGDTVGIEVESRARIDPGAIAGLRRRGAREGVVLVVVGDRISKAARQELAEQGVSWFDRRGHLRLVAPRVFVDTETPPAERPIPTSSDGVKGRAGLAYAVAALLSPNDPPTVRGVARAARLSAPAVSVAAASLRRAALVHTDGRPILPDLFWAVAEVWRPNFVPLGGSPTATRENRADQLWVFGEPDSAGWALTGTVAAAAWGAPLVAPAGLAAAFYVPDTRTVALARRMFADAPAESAACSIAPAPTPAACGPRRRLRSPPVVLEAPFLLTRPLFVALELANDPARGREILTEWTPEDGSRVW